MNSIIAKVNGISFRKLIWILPIGFAFHEMEEWNIIPWYQAHIINQPEMTYLSLLIVLVCSSLVGFVWTFFAFLFQDEIKVTAGILLLFFIPIAFGNAIVHISYTIMFGAYCPGVLGSVFLIIPSVIYVTWRVIKERLLPEWYIITLYLLMIPNVIEFIRYGNEVPPIIVSYYRFAYLLAGQL